MAILNDHDERKLVSALAEVAKRGPIQAVSKGSNAVGKTLQNALGIEHSTTNRNTLFNHTITATQSNSGSTRRTNLFACVPDWEQSCYKSSKALAEKFGREDLSRGYAKSLFCTVTSLAPNGFKLMLQVDKGTRSIEEVWVSDAENRKEVVKWSIDVLERKLESLGKTAIVTALPVGLPEGKAFHYRYVDLYGVPQAAQFLELLEDGVISVDHCLSIKVGSNQAREQGPLFKIRADGREGLYGEHKRIDLLDL